MADQVFTPETAAWGMPAMPSGRRGMNFTKEDLLSALVQAQNQPKSPYQLQFEAPILPPQQQDREADFQNQWDQAMQAYQARVSNPRILPPGISYAGQSGNLDTPEAAFQATLAPLRFQAAEFSPGISKAFTEQELLKPRLEEQVAHWKALQDEAAQRLGFSRENLDIRKELQDLKEREFESKQSKQPAKFTDIPSTDDKGWLLKHIEDPAAWDRFESKYGPGSVKVEIPKAKDPRPLWSNLDVPQQVDLSTPLQLSIPPEFSRAPNPSFSLAGLPQPEGPNRTFGMPKVGEIRAGFRFKGGDPSVRSNWEAVK